MTLSALINRPCTLLRRSKSGATDELGDSIDAEVTVATVCELQQIRRTEPGEYGEISVVEDVAFFPPGTLLDTGDGLLVPGAGRFEVIGDPNRTRNPRTTLDGQVEATLKRTAGAEDVTT